MAEISDFRTGDRVQHIAMGAGTVFGTGDAVTIRYDKSDRLGNHATGIYDNAWFRLHPDAIVLSPPSKE